MKTPKAPVTSPQQKAFDTEQRRALNKETQEENRRRKALARGQLGAVTLLGGLPPDEGVVNFSGGGSTAPGGVLDGSSSSVTSGVVTGGNSSFQGGRRNMGGARSNKK